jgi:hypothetical protein
VLGEGEEEEEEVAMADNDEEEEVLGEHLALEAIRTALDPGCA